jgi:hypothetical protein
VNRETEVYLAIPNAFFTDVLRPRPLLLVLSCFAHVWLCANRLALPILGLCCPPSFTPHMMIWWVGEEAVSEPRLGTMRGSSGESLFEEDLQTPERETSQLGRESFELGDGELEKKKGPSSCDTIIVTIVSGFGEDLEEGFLHRSKEGYCAATEP